MTERTEIFLTKRKAVIKKIVALIVTECEEPNKGNLTTLYAIGLLKEAINVLEMNSLRLGVRTYLENEES